MRGWCADPVRAVDPSGFWAVNAVGVCIPPRDRKLRVAGNTPQMTDIRMYMYVHTDVCMHVCMYACMHLCVHMQI